MKNEQIQEILVDHKKWLESGGKEGERAYLRRGDLSGAVLHWADLREANLSGAVLHWADLREANLSGGDLRRADLHGANLSGANLSGGDLREANLSGAVLSGANLRGANLSGANLRGADLHRADLRGANLRGADLHRADLRGADIDFACWPLWCGSLCTNVDERIARQLLYHAFVVGIEFFPGGLTEDQKKWLQEFEHATDEVNSKM